MKTQTAVTFEYDSASSRSPVIREIVELWHYRDMLRQLVTNSVKTRYRRSTLGVFWTLLNPLLNTIVLTIAFSQVFKFAIDNFPVYLFSGLLFWGFFTQSTTTAMGQLVWGSSLIKRIYVPRTIFAVAVLGNGLVNLVFSFVALLIIMLVTGHPLYWTLLLLPVAILFLAVFTLGIALFVSILAILFADFVEIYNVLLSALYFSIPLIYPVDILPERVVFFLTLNPLFKFLELFRDLIYVGQVPSWEVFAWTGISALLSLVLGWWYFTKRVDEIAYRI